MKLILVRHAETTANTKSVILGGREGGELSERGVKQAKALALRLRNERFNEVYCSQANRARQTCAILSEGRDVPVSYREELREIDMGDLAGLSHEEADEKYPHIFSKIADNPKERIPGGESIQDVQARALPLMESLAQKEGNPTVLVVGHNIVNRVILATVLGMPLQRIKFIKQKNACWALLDMRPGFAQLYTLDNSIHSVR